MHLYGLTLQRASSICQAIYGSFSAPKQQEIVVAKGKVLELLRPDDNGKVQTICSTEVFGVIRALACFRLTGQNKDYMVIGSDSGRIVILEYNSDRAMFGRVHQETFGKTGCRRIVPGQYLAVDPRGRSVMIGAIEKQKMVYVLNRDAANRLTISSPLEAHKSFHLTFHMIGLDVGFENPIFASIELDYSDADADTTGEALEEASKELVYYELDLGLNHVIRKWSDPVDLTANYLIAVPGGNEGPGGVLVCSENWIVYKNMGHPDRRAPIPRRAGLPGERGTLIVSSATHKQKGMFFFLAQSEYGDLYRIKLDYTEEVVNVVRVKYFDTIPTAAALCVMRSGFLFCAAEAGNHYLYQFLGIGDTEDLETSSAMDLEELSEDDVLFKPRPPENLGILDEIPNIGPVCECNIMDLCGEESPQMYALCGKGGRSTLRTMRHGLAVQEMAVSELPGNPNAVWTVKTAGDEYDRYIVVSFVNATLVLSIGETVEEVTDSGFLATAPTLSASLIGDDALLQIYPSGIRHIRTGSGRTNEWKCPGKKTIVASSVNLRQVVIALTGGELLYFELDAVSGDLQEVERKETGHEIAAVDVAPIPLGRLRQRFLAVGGGSDNTVRILSLDPEDCLQVLSVQALPSVPASLCMRQMGGDSEGETTLYLHVGLGNGVLLRTAIDPVTGQLQDTRTRFLGTRAVKLFGMKMREAGAVLALSSRSWLCYDYQGSFLMTPLSYEMLEYASGFNSEQCADGIVAVAGNTLRIIMVERLGQVFNETTLPLKYTPRTSAVIPGTSHLVVIEADHGVLPDDEKLDDVIVPYTAPMDDEDDEADEVVWDESVYGQQRGEEGQWGSCIRVVDVKQSENLQLIQLNGSEAAFSCCPIQVPCWPATNRPTTQLFFPCRTVAVSCPAIV
jgi:splicing factor 3B subunit 3